MPTGPVASDSGAEEAAEAGVPDGDGVADGVGLSVAGAAMEVRPLGTIVGVAAVELQPATSIASMAQAAAVAPEWRVPFRIDRICLPQFR